MKTKNIVGAQIRHYRMQAGLTQSALADALGVTVQAVSKWERGGAPDIAMLPDIADRLSVSIDTLFGQSDEIKKDLTQLIDLELKNTSDEERFQKAYQYAWSAMIGAIQVESLHEMMRSNHSFMGNQGQDYLMEVLQKQGYMLGNITEGHQYAFFALSDGSEYDARVASVSEYTELFTLLSDPINMKILLFMMTRPETKAVTTAFVAKSLRKDREVIKTHLKTLCEGRLLGSHPIESEEGEISVYLSVKQPWLAAVLMLAANMIHNDLVMMNATLPGEEVSFLRKYQL